MATDEKKSKGKKEKKRIPFIAENFVTPPGAARYPRLNKPDTGGKNFTLEVPVYRVDIVLEGEALTKTRAKLDAFLQKAHQEAQEKAERVIGLGPHSCLVPFVDDDGDEVPGKGILKAKMKARTAKGAPRRPTLVDAKKAPLFELIGGGSTIRVAGQFRAYETPAVGFGVAFDLNVVQVLKLVSVGLGAGLSDLDEEEGYESPGDADPAQAGTSNDDDGDPDF